MHHIIETFKPLGGQHCITGSLRQVFHHYGYFLSEEMLFGLGEGLDFTYINLADSPMVSGRAKIMEFEQVLAANLGIKIAVKQHKDCDKVFAATKRMIDDGHPVLAYVDMPFLPYFGLGENSHFGGHSVVLFGYDDEKEHFYVSDRDSADFPVRSPNGPLAEDFHLVSYTQMRAARSSNHRPFPANNKYLVFDFSGFAGVGEEQLRGAIRTVCQKMLHPLASLKGVDGIRKFAKEIKKWNKFDDEKLRRTGVTNYFQISHDGGTGGGIFRKMYGGFLVEASEILGSNDLRQLGEAFIALSERWDALTGGMWALHESGDAGLLAEMSQDIAQMADAETALLERLQAY